MKGIADKPFINCDKYIDTDKLKSLDKKIIYGIANSNQLRHTLVMTYWKIGNKVNTSSVPLFLI